MNDRGEPLPQATGTVGVPTEVRVRLAHGVAQRLAELHDVDLLHVKGPAVDPTVREPKRSSDADVLVRPAHLTRFVAALRAGGWEERSGFDEGSAFGHAANWHHPGLGYLDVHRRWPGPTLPADEVFERWWSQRTSVTIASRACPTPDVDTQALIILLHAARDRGQADTEVARLWRDVGSERRAALREQAADLGAEVALAAAVGELDQHRDAPDYHLWLAHSTTETDRLDDWVGRWRAARGVPAHLALLGRALVVNRAHLAMQLGRAPRPGEVAAAWFQRWGRLLRELGARAGRRHEGGAR